MIPTVEVVVAATIRVKTMTVRAIRTEIFSAVRLPGTLVAQTHRWQKWKELRFRALRLESKSGSPMSAVDRIDFERRC